jgi:Domain of unknown function (DUF2019)
MTQASLEELSTDDLVALFAENCVEQDRAIFKDQISKFNQIFRRMTDINAELKRRGPQARLALTSLYEHPTAQVRLQAARLTLAVAPLEARRVIEAIARSTKMPQAADARGTVRNLDTGFLKPV